MRGWFFLRSNFPVLSLSTHLSVKTKPPFYSPKDLVEKKENSGILEGKDTSLAGVGGPDRIEI